jgi:hypothetical protein
MHMRTLVDFAGGSHKLLSNLVLTKIGFHRRKGLAIAMSLTSIKSTNVMDFVA